MAIFITRGYWFRSGSLRCSSSAWHPREDRRPWLGSFCPGYGNLNWGAVALTRAWIVFVCRDVHFEQFAFPTCQSIIPSATCSSEPKNSMVTVPKRRQPTHHVWLQRVLVCRKWILYIHISLRIVYIYIYVYIYICQSFIVGLGVIAR